MTLRSRLVIALAFAAVVPTAVVVTGPILQAGRRAEAETDRRIAQARRQAEVLLEEERTGLANAADRAAADLRAHREGLAAVLRGPEGLADDVARGLRERFALDRIRVVGTSGAALASSGGGSSGPGSLSETRRVEADTEILSLDAERDLGPQFLARVSAVTGGDARLAESGAACGPIRAEAPVSRGVVLCVPVPAVDLREVRRDLLGAFAGTATAALLAALLLGVLLAARISRP